MAIIKPFKGIRPPQNLVEQVASRPYDVLNSEEARAEAEGNEKSLYHIIKPEIDFPVGMDEHDERVYAKAAENFQLFQDKGWLVQDNKENYYIYAQTMNGKTQYGLVVGAYVPDYMNGMDATCPLEGSDTKVTPDGFWKRTVFETRVFKSNHYLYPFSQRELDRNKLLTTNYGW